MTPEQFAAKWPGPRSRMDRGLANTLNIPGTSREFLVQAGLPVDVGFNGVGFDISTGRLRRLPERSSLVQVSRPGGGRICIDEAARGQVIQFEDTPDGPQEQFLNSSVEQHAEFWLVWRMVVDSSGAEDDQVTAALLRRTWSEIDPPSVTGPEDPWSRLVEEIEHGML